MTKLKKKKKKADQIGDKGLQGCLVYQDSKIFEYQLKNSP